MRSDPDRFDPGAESLLGREQALGRGIIGWMQTGRSLGAFRGPLLVTIGAVALIILIAVLINAM